MVARRRVRMDPPRLANTCSDVTIPLTGRRAIACPALRACSRPSTIAASSTSSSSSTLATAGSRSSRSTRARSGYIGHIARAGLDLPWMSYLDAQGLPVPAQAPYQIGRYGLYEIPDATAIVRAWIALPPPAWAASSESWLRGRPGAVLVAAIRCRRSAACRTSSARGSVAWLARRRAAATEPAGDLRRAT